MSEAMELAMRSDGLTTRLIFEAAPADEVLSSAGLLNCSVSVDAGAPDLLAMSDRVFAEAASWLREAHLRMIAERLQAAVAQGRTRCPSVEVGG